MTAHTDAERAEFERTVADGMYGGLIGLISDHWDSVKGEYKLFQHQVAWIAWQAARRAPAAPVPQGWKLVPVEPTTEMIQRACSDHGYPGGSRWVYRDGYRSMLAAAPQPPEADIDTQELEHTRQEAESLAWNIFNRHFSSDEHYASGRVKFGLCDTLRGVLSQIDNMVAGLVRAPEAAPVQLPEPAAWVFKDRTWTEIRAMAVDHDGVPAYTEQQVRELLEANGIKVAP